MSDLFTRPLELWRSASAGDGMGGSVETFAQVGGDPLLWKVDQPSAKDLRLGAAYGATLTHAIYGDGDVDVRRGDELRDPDGLVYDVRFVLQPSEPVYTKAMCELRQEQAG